MLLRIGYTMKLDFWVHLRKISQKMGLTQVEQDFSSFFAKFFSIFKILSLKGYSWLLYVEWYLGFRNRVLEIRFLGSRNQPKNGFSISWIRLFFIFCYVILFAIFDYFSKFLSTFGMSPLWKIIKYANIGKKWRKTLYNLR